MTGGVGELGGVGERFEGDAVAEVKSRGVVYGVVV